MSDKWNPGSRWHRWDPHLHVPGTLRNDQFGGDWDAYFRQIAAAAPAPVALGITDYFTMRGYKEFIRRRPEGELPSVALVFPNIELRMTIETKTKQGINFHLLVSPEDPEHVRRIEEKLMALRYKFANDWYPCADESLKRLGRAHRRDASLSDEAALADGANQFKMEFEELRGWFQSDAWLQANVLVAVAAGNDGLSGISEDSQWHTRREELARFAHIVFSANPGDRKYWLGDRDALERNNHTPKPCLHGSDAHTLDDVLRPDLDRRCWIRAEPTFDGLRQTLAEPERRVHIGPEPPEGPSDSNVIRRVRFRSAAWLQNEKVELNPGLVTVIGARGSGKTALADLIALAAEADEEKPGEASFIKKAGALLNGLEVEIEWGDGARQSGEFPRSGFQTTQPRVRYLSQKFVESLCAPDSDADALDEEIEHVVFSAVPEEDRLLCSTFAELRDTKLHAATEQVKAERQDIAAKTEQVGQQVALQRSLEAIKKKVQECERARLALEAELAKIPVKASDETVKAHAAAHHRLQELKNGIATEQRREQTAIELGQEIDRQVRATEQAWAALRQKYQHIVSPDDWAHISFQLNDAARPTLSRIAADIRANIVALRERGLRDHGDLAKGLSGLEAECAELTKALGLDQANAKRRVELDRHLTTAKLAEQNARTEQGKAENADGVIKQLRADRAEAYQRVFVALEEQAATLRGLYAPLHERLSADRRLEKLTFIVQRVVDGDSWASRGERLFDLRRAPFNGAGELAKVAQPLLAAWRTGTPEEVRAAMVAFLPQAAKQPPHQDVTNVQIGEWLFSTDHIRVQYAIRYDGLDLAQLSPGTRGVVLLTLYLALDQWDQRPLVIDQPEENLDPRSVYDDLRPFFRDAACRRQIIMVTHNANLVVNTDSDKVIVASSSRTLPTELPQVTYVAGGLEDRTIRDEVCRILEGGREAFEKRRQRYLSPSHSTNLPG
ncbi:MAG: TrlF family AAA-like ATPase [Polyangiaceae bacterium]